MAADVSRRDIGRLLIRCADRPGTVAAVSGFLAEHGANIISPGSALDGDQRRHVFQRMEFHCPACPPAATRWEAEFLERVAQPMGMDVRLTDAARPKRVAIMVSKQDHCLLDLLWRSRRGELHMTIPMVISNHLNLADPVRPFAVPFFHIPVTADRKPEAERRQLELLADNVDLVVLARYMQILSRDFLDAVGCPLINIHHSFLPAFVGAKPYEREGAWRQADRRDRAPRHRGSR